MSSHWNGISRHEVFSPPRGQWHTLPLTHRMGSSLGLNPLSNPRIKCMKTLSGATGFWGRKAGSSRSTRRVVEGDAQHVVAHSLTKRMGGKASPRPDRQTDRRPQRPCGHSHEQAGPGALDRKRGPAFVWGWLRSWGKITRVTIVIHSASTRRENATKNSTSKAAALRRDGRSPGCWLRALILNWLLCNNTPQPKPRSVLRNAAAERGRASRPAASLAGRGHHHHHHGPLVVWGDTKCCCPCALHHKGPTARMAPMAGRAPRPASAWAQGRWVGKEKHKPWAQVGGKGGNVLPVFSLGEGILTAVMSVLTSRLPFWDRKHFVNIYINILILFWIASAVSMAWLARLLCQNWKQSPTNTGMGEWFRANPHLGYVKGAHIFQTETQPLLYTNQIGIQTLNCSPHPTWASAAEQWPSVAADTLQKHRLHPDAELCARGNRQLEPKPKGQTHPEPHHGRCMVLPVPHTRLPEGSGPVSLLS